MGYRDRSLTGKYDSFDYRILEVEFTKVGAPEGTREQKRLVTVDNHLDTLMFVQGHLNDCIDNIVKLKRMEDAGRAGGAG